jgi:hypothetical protein
MRRQEEPQYNQ